MNLLEHDEKDRSDLFVWNGPLDGAELGRWIRERGLSVPNELIRLWQRTGGGEMFETETLLAPFGDDIEAVNRVYQAKGLSPEYLVFQTGCFVSAIHLTSSRWVVLNAEGIIDETYDSLDSWYAGTLRAEFAERYGLGASTPVL